MKHVTLWMIVIVVVCGITSFALAQSGDREVYLPLIVRGGGVEPVPMATPTRTAPPEPPPPEPPPPTATNEPSTPTATSTPGIPPTPFPTSPPTSTPIVPPIPTSPPNCHPSYPTVCIPPPPPDLDCGDIPHRNFTVLPPDPHRFDRDNDGIGCEQ